MSRGIFFHLFSASGRYLALQLAYTSYMPFNENILDLLAEESYLQKKQKYMILTTVTTLIKLMSTGIVR
jgi:hypothetical protein